ncbi:MAG: lytic transglycosylase domain-containing protein [Candidatus Rokubacteria bacterium]|nr:lytic transglycosylase domain-containing protein [Candidatus Rokubacteria bacterium]MBI3825814.1 lytic transglycosylase domain-containing protein [Candidatus Rokubacteria bacterium]
MSQHSRALAVLTFGLAVALSGLLVTKQVVAVTGEAESQRLHQAILDHVAEKNPQAPMKAFKGFPAVLLAEARHADLDHCLVLAQAEVESQFREDAVGRSGEIGLFQMLPSTAALLEPTLGPFRRPVMTRGRRDLGELGDPVVSTRFAMAHMRDILARKPNVKDALIEYNGGPGGRRDGYYRQVMGTYVEVLANPDLRCQGRPIVARGGPDTAPAPPFARSAPGTPWRSSMML